MLWGDTLEMIVNAYESDLEEEDDCPAHFTKQTVELISG